MRGDRWADLPGTASAPLGDVAITVRDKFPDKSFFRVHPDVPIFHMLHHTAGIDKEYYLVMPNEENIQRKAIAQIAERDKVAGIAHADSVICAARQNPKSRGCWPTPQPA